MEYNWDINRIKAIKKDLEINYLKYDEYIVSQDLRDINELLEFSKTIEHTSSNNLQKCYIGEKDTLLSFKHLWELCFEYDKLCNTYKQQNLRNLSYSKEELLTLVHDFFKNFLGGSLYSLFLNDFNKRFTNLKLEPLKKDAEYAGISYYLYIPKETFIFSRYNNDFDDILTLIHEYGHAVQDQLNPDYSLLPYIEIPSLFLEYLSYFYFGNFKEYKEEVFKCFIRQNNLNRRDLTKLLLEIRLIKQNFKMEIETSLLPKLAQELNTYSDFLKETILSKSSQHLPYIISHIIAVELVYLFIQDKEKALYVFQKIICFDEDSSYIFLNNIKELGIIPNQNITNFNNLVRNLKL